MHDIPLAAIAEALARREFSSVEITEALLQRIESANPALNAFVTIDREGALRAAAAADAARARGATGRLLGVPIAHKDLFCTAGLRTTCGSRMLGDFVPPYDATVVERLAAAGCVNLGKTNMDEFAMGSSNETSWFGPVRNPWDTTRVPGGSSGGSAAAVAARLAPAATATDTGGSIRQPASLCGLTGLKATYGRVSRWGMIAFASSLDQAGPIARSAEDCALLLREMAGLDPRDSTSIDAPVPDYVALLDRPLQGLRVGIPREYFDPGLSPGTAAAVQAGLAELERQGARLVDISLPHSGLSVPAYYVIAPAECSANLSRYDGVRYGYRCKDPADLQDLYERSRSEGFGDEVKRRILVGTYALSAGYYDAYYRKAQQVRRLIAEDFRAAFEQVDVVAGPACPGTAFRFGEKSDDPITMYLEDIYTIAANLAGLPAMSMPGGLVDGLPVGIQLIGNHLQEGLLLNVAHRFQQATDWHLRAAPAAA
ncbi:MAG: Asp-tRNA(Asn)/Glu-tRNA(Gln) amidotransferase subunit GatA [Gammaproteobacteria bacterium]